LSLLLSYLHPYEFLKLFPHIRVFLEPCTDVVNDEAVFVVLEIKLAKHFSLFDLLLEQCEDLAARVKVLN